MPKPVSSSPAIETSTLLLIVVGAHPKAEMGDRPTAYRLRQRMLDALSAKAARGVAEGESDAAVFSAMTPLVVTDVWYLNDASLRDCPTVAIGAPGVNALSAYLGDKLPGALVFDDVFMVQLDPAINDSADLVACCWGVSSEATASAADAFASRYLSDFLDTAARRMTVD
jgi:hypothetical protein